MNKEQQIIEIIAANCEICELRKVAKVDSAKIAKEIMALDDWNYDMSEAPRDGDLIVRHMNKSGFGYAWTWWYENRWFGLPQSSEIIAWKHITPPKDKE